MNIVINRDRNTATPKLVEELYKAFAGKLLAYTKKHYAISEDDAMGLVYKTIYRIAEVNDRYSFENEHKRAAFVFKTHINYLRNYFRDNKSFEARNREIELSEAHLSTEQELPAKESLQMKILQQQLDLLEEWERILLLMRGQEMPYSEIAKFVNRPEKQLKVYYARLKKELLVRVNGELEKQNKTGDEKK
jgi:RNA polymerase sigma factor (sigma-70 family)